VALPAALVASLTDSMSRTILWSFVLCFFVISVPGVIGIALSGRTSSQIPPLGGVIALLVATLPMFVVLCRQYLRRDQRGSLIWLAVGVPISWAAAFGLAVGLSLLHSDFQRTLLVQSGWRDWRDERAKDVVLSPHSFSVYRPRPASGETEITFDTFLTATGVPSDLMLVAGQTGRQTWTWRGGQVVSRETLWFNTWGGYPAMRRQLGISEPKADDETARYQKESANAVAKTRNEDYEKTVRALSEVYRQVPIGVRLNANLFPSMVDRMRQSPPGYAASVQLHLVKPEAWIEIPLAASGWRARAGYGFRLGERIPRDQVEARESQLYDRELDNVPGTVAFPVVATMPDFLWDSIFAEQFWIRRRWEQPQLYVINRAGGDLIGQNIYRTPRISIAGVGVVRDTVRAWTPALRRGNTWVARDPQWLDGAKLVLVGVREEARFTREVKAERFMNPP
jgi:hypothetical protein